MKLITQRQNCTRFVFPDGQPHVRLFSNIECGDSVNVVWYLNNCDDLFELCLLGNALKHRGAKIKDLYIPYLLAARSDRVMQEGDSFDLEEVAAMVNRVSAKRVVLFDVHSPVALQHIYHAENKYSLNLMNGVGRDHEVLIVPDKGGIQRAQMVSWYLNHQVTTVFCTKSRDVLGRVTLTVNQPELCEGKSCLVVDDICDGGATFVSIADQIKPSQLTLAVTHGLFSKGDGPLLAAGYTRLVTTDSTMRTMPRNVDVVPLFNMEDI